MLFILDDSEDRIEHFRRELGDTPHHIERAAPEALGWLRQHAGRVTLYSLDNDLYVPDYDGDEGEGWQVCEWILDNAPERPMIVHTTNSHAATRMEMACDAAGWAYHRVVPYLGMRWIGERWIETMRSLLKPYEQD